jgi:hypothetical protein
VLEVVATFYGVVSGSVHSKAGFVGGVSCACWCRFVAMIGLKFELDGWGWVWKIVG